MSFANGWLTLGAFAFTIPLAIHLFHRSRFRTVHWGAMHLLDGVLRENRRRIEWINLLLLFLRCLVPVLLAFCLARPILHGIRAASGSNPRTIILAIDDSRSMAYVESDGVSRMQVAQRGLRKLLDSLSRRDEVLLVRTSQVNQVARSMGLAEAKREIARMKANSGPMDLGRLMRAASLAASDARHPDRQIVVVSDFQSHMLSDKAFETLRELGANQNSDTQSEVAQFSPAVTFWNTHSKLSLPQRVSNVSVDSIEVDSTAVVTGRDTAFTATIRNHGDTAVEEVRLVWSIGGISLRPQTVSILPRSTQTSRIKYRFTQVGSQEVALAIEHPDPLSLDNRRAIAVDIISDIKVLLVDGQPSEQPLGGRADYLQVALSPFALSQQDQRDAVRTERVDPSGAIKRLVTGAYDIVILAGVASPNESLRGQLARFVSRGGHLVVFDHPSLDPSIYNSPWLTTGADASTTISFQLPAIMGDFVDNGQPSAVDESAVPTQSWKIVPLRDRFPAWNVLSDNENRLVDDIEVHRYRQLDGSGLGTVQRDPDLRQTITILSLDNGDPIAVMAIDGAERSNRGRIVQFAISADLTSSTMPIRMAFLPMIQQLVLELAGARNRTTFQVGESIFINPRHFGQETDDAQRNNPPLVVTYPDDRQKVLPLGRADQANTGQIIFSDTELPGSYRFRLNTRTDKPKNDSSPVQLIRVVEVPSLESSQQFVDSRRLTQASDIFDGQVQNSIDGLLAGDQVQRLGREISQWFFIPLILFLIAELWIQQKLGGNAQPVVSRQLNARQPTRSRNPTDDIAETGKFGDAR